MGPEVVHLDEVRAVPRFFLARFADPWRVFL